MMPETDATVFIIDDDPSARRGFTRLIRAAGMRAESFASAKAFLDREYHHGPGCILLDVKMPDMTGPELQEELRKAEYSMPIIFISGHGDVPTSVLAMKKGAVDFLTKPVDRDELLAAVKSSLQRDKENRESHQELTVIRERWAMLTPRESEIATYVITGMLNKQIAHALGIAEDTVKIHRARVMRKLEVVSVPDLVRLCGRLGVAPAEIQEQ
jgi:FixJ family two-component response regulator